MEFRDSATSLRSNSKHHRLESTHALTATSRCPVRHSLTTYTHSPSHYNQSLVTALLHHADHTLSSCSFDSMLIQTSATNNTNHIIRLYPAHSLHSRYNTSHTGQTVRILTTYIDGNHHLAAVIIILSSHRYTTLHDTHTHT